MARCACAAAEAAGITKDPWHTQPHLQPATLVTIDTVPFVGETPMEVIQNWITPIAIYCARNHFETPLVDVNQWTLDVDGLVSKPLSLTYSDVPELPQRTLVVTMECAGNNRTDLTLPVKGSQFGDGAISTAIWVGVSLRYVLELAGVADGAVEVFFEGVDSERGAPGQPVVPYQRSLLMEAALHPDTVLAYLMNSEELPTDHGYPIRLVVPGWYGMASVKWLNKITVLDHLFEGFFQADRYIMENEDGGMGSLRDMVVKSLITSPRHGQIFDVRPHQITGLAWSGEGAVTKVEISDDFGQNWRPAKLGGLNLQYAWQQWATTWQPQYPGHHTLMARATDASGSIQPMETNWNELGYAINGAQSVCVNVE
jgi:sulfite oxidase